jgi:hypothetical protein
MVCGESLAQASRHSHPQAPQPMGRRVCSVQAPCAEFIGIRETPTAIAQVAKNVFQGYR